MANPERQASSAKSGRPPVIWAVGYALRYARCRLARSVMRQVIADRSASPVLRWVRAWLSKRNAIYGDPIRPSKGISNSGLGPLRCGMHGDRDAADLEGWAATSRPFRHYGQATMRFAVSASISVASTLPTPVVVSVVGLRAKSELLPVSVKSGSFCAVFAKPFEAKWLRN